MNFLNKYFVRFAYKIIRKYEFPKKKIFVSGRGYGKTSWLLNEANKLDGYNLIVCKDRKEVMRLWTIILDEKYDLPQPITFEEFIEGRFSGKNINSFLIDNADLLIERMVIPIKISAMSFSKGYETVILK